MPNTSNIYELVELSHDIPDSRLSNADYRSHKN